MATVSSALTTVVRPPSRHRYVQDLVRLQKAAQTIASTLDLEVLLTEVVNEIAISFGCIEASVWLRDDTLDEMVCAGVKGCSVSHKGDRLKIGVEGMVGRAAATGSICYAPNVLLDPYYIACEPGVKSEVDIPLKVGDRVIGVFSAVHDQFDAFPPDKVAVLQALAGHIAIAVENARRFQAERQTNLRLSREADEARAIQKALFPKSSPLIPGITVEAVNCPAGAVGGDWYDFIELSDNRWGFVLADVSGKGTAAALLMSATRAMLRSVVQSCDCGPGQSLARLNEALVRDFPAGRYVTMVYAVLDGKTKTVTLANAGHPCPLLVSGGSVDCVDTENGLPLGLGDSKYVESRFTLNPGSRLVLFSDGISEASNSTLIEYGEDRIADHLADPAATAASLLDSVRDFEGSASATDDATVIVLKAV